MNGAGRGGIWPLKQMVAVANGNGKSGISPNGLATQVFQSAQLAADRPAAPHSESRPSFLEFITCDDDEGGEGPGGAIEYGGPAQI